MEAEGSLETKDLREVETTSAEITADLPAPRRRRKRGPKTPEGKVRVGLNAVRHAMCASMPVIPGIERVEEWDAHRGGILDSLAPVGHLEMVLADRVALLFWRLDRVAAYERAELAAVHNLVGDGERRVHLPPPEKLDKLVRYEAHLNRTLYQTMHELEALQTRRHGEPAPLARLDVHGLPDGG